MRDLATNRAPEGATSVSLAAPPGHDEGDATGHVPEVLAGNTLAHAGAMDPDLVVLGDNVDLQAAMHIDADMGELVRVCKHHFPKAYSTIDVCSLAAECDKVPVLAAESHRCSEMVRLQKFLNDAD